MKHHDPNRKECPFTHHDKLDCTCPSTKEEKHRITCPHGFPLDEKGNNLFHQCPDLDTPHRVAPLPNNYSAQKEWLDRTMNEALMAYVSHWAPYYTELRQVLSKHQNEWKNELLADLASLITRAKEAEASRILSEAEKQLEAEARYYGTDKHGLSLADS